MRALISSGCFGAREHLAGEGALDPIYHRPLPPGDMGDDIFDRPIRLRARAACHFLVAQAAPEGRQRRPFIEGALQQVVRAHVGDPAVFVRLSDHNYVFPVSPSPALKAIARPLLKALGSGRGWLLLSIQPAVGLRKCLDFGHGRHEIGAAMLGHHDRAAGIAEPCRSVPTPAFDQPVDEAATEGIARAQDIGYFKPGNRARR